MDAEALEFIRRNSGLTLDAQGRFHSAGVRVANDRVQALFHRNLAVRENGDVTLTLGEVWAYVNTETVARFVTALHRNEDLLSISYLDGRSVEADDPRICAGPDNRLYLWEAPGAYPSVLLRSAHSALAELLEEREQRIGFQLGEKWVVVAELEKSPGPCGR